MKLVLLLLFPLLAAMSAPSLEATSYDLNELRRRYQRAANDAGTSAELYQWLKSATERQGGVVLAYRAASEALQAKHTGGMFDKLDRLKTANKLFADAVNLEPRNAEVRFLRYTIETNVPAFLGMSKHRDEDLALLREALKKPGGIKDATLRGAVEGFLKERQELP